MPYACDKCIAKQVNQGIILPLNTIWRGNIPPFKNNSKCEICGDIGMVSLHPAVLIPVKNN